ncbi:MAG: sigma-70 family RNA polymerase sigma factor [Planctomycetes bacterium]|nr:sigma-70 family RNA polymerase sigma factor [Planctomycetota bacterium]
MEPSAIDRVLEQAPYVRALARKLVFDAHLARDVEQEVLLAALEHAPRERGALRGWLKVIVRNFAIKAWRSSSRRARRERASARPEASVPSPAEILEREDQRRALVERVLALDEPLRAVLVLRFFEELPPREVARRLALPIETVHSRTRRGLELLRERLDRESGGGRAVWCLAFVRVFWMPAGLTQLGPALVASSLSGVVLMSLTKKMATAAVALALVASVALLLRRSERREEGQRPVEGVLLAPAPVEAAPETQQVDAPHPVPSAEREAIAPPAETTPEVATTGSVLLRVLWHDGQPAADVAATARVSGSEEGHGEGLEVRTGADGICRIEGLSPGKIWFDIDRSDESWRAEVVPGEEVELLVTLPRGYDVFGQVTAEGAAVSGAEIWLDLKFVGWGGHRVARSDAEGRYRVRSIEDGMCWIGARAPRRAPSPCTEVMGGPGATLEVPLEFTEVGGVLEGRVLDLEGRPIAAAQVLVGDELDQRFMGVGKDAPGAQRTLCDASGSFRFEGVEPGLRPVRAQAPGCAPWSGEIEILAGSTATQAVTLFPGTSVCGIVTDRAGRPVPSADVRFGIGLFGGRSSFTGADGTFVLHDLPMGEFELVVDADSRGRVSARLFGAVGAELVWNPVVEGSILRGRLALNGLDPAQCRVRCEAEDLADNYLEEVRVDATGSFEFTGLPGSSYALQVLAAGEYSFPMAELHDVHPGPEEIVLELDLARWPSIRLRGRVVDASERPMPGVVFSPWRVGQNTAPLLTTREDGTFDVGPYPPGSWFVQVRHEGDTRVKSEVVELGRGETWDFGDLRPVP